MAHDKSAKTKLTQLQFQPNSFVILIAAGGGISIQTSYMLITIFSAIYRVFIRKFR